MSTNRIKEKLSSLVASQLPEFVQTDYSTFISFLEAYYEFLEQDQESQEILQNALSYSDIDRTIDTFIEYFTNQYCVDLPKNILSNKNLTVKKIQEIYFTKGSEKSYNLLFQLLFNKKPEFLYPGDLILKASDGKWKNDTSIFLRTGVGDPTTIENKLGIVKTSSTVYPIFIKTKHDVKEINELSDSKESIISGGVFEFKIDNSKNIPINVGDIVQVGNYIGTVVGVPVSVKVESSGKGFKAGQIFNLQSGAGRNAKIKITRVDTTGKILNVVLINFGINYISDFYQYITSSQKPKTRTTALLTGNTFYFTTNTPGFIDKGTIYKEPYSSSYAYDYAGTLLRTFYYDSADISGDPTTDGSDAVISVQIGAKANYPGYYRTNEGFISDAMYLESEEYYQPYAYVIKIDEELKLYKQAVRSLLHPAGMKLIGEYELKNAFEILPEVISSLKFLTTDLEELLGLKDSLEKTLQKNLFDNYTLNDIIVKTLNIPFEDNFTQLDSANLIVIKNILDSAILNDEINFDTAKNIIDNISVEESLSKFAVLDNSDSFTIEDNSSYNGIFSIEDNVLLEDSELLKDFIFNNFETLNFIDENSYSLSTDKSDEFIIQDSLSIDSTVVLSEDTFTLVDAAAVSYLNEYSSIIESVLDNASINIDFNFIDESIIQESLSINSIIINKDILTLNDTFTIGYFYEYLSIIESVLDNVSINIDFNFIDESIIQESLSIDSTINILESYNILDSGNVFQTDYTTGDYFAELYQGIVLQSF